jgi:hypothetical protein
MTTQATKKNHHITATKKNHQFYVHAIATVILEIRHAAILIFLGPFSALSQRLEKRKWYPSRYSGRGATH